MARITVEDCLTKETNRFALIHLSSKRTKQLLQGASVVLGEACDNKPVVTSLREIAEGKVRFMSQEEMDRLKELGLEEQVPGLEEAALQRAAAERAAKLAAAQEQAAAEKTLAEEPDADEETPSRNGNSENGHSHIKSASKDELAEIADDILKDDAVELLAGDDGTESDGTESDGTESEGTESEGTESEGTESDGAESGGVKSEGAAPKSADDSEEADDSDEEDSDEDDSKKKTPGADEEF